MQKLNQISTDSLHEYIARAEEMTATQVMTVQDDARTKAEIIRRLQHDLNNELSTNRFLLEMLQEWSGFNDLSAKAQITLRTQTSSLIGTAKKQGKL